MALIFLLFISHIESYFCRKDAAPIARFFAWGISQGIFPLKKRTKTISNSVRLFRYANRDVVRMLFAKSSQPSGGTSPSLPTLLFYLPLSFIPAAFGVLCYRDFTSCTRRVSVSLSNSSAFIPPPSSGIETVVPSTISDSRHGRERFFFRPLYRARFWSLSRNHESTFCAIISPWSLSPSRFSSATSHPVSWKRNRRVEWKPTRGVRGPARKAELILVYCAFRIT